MSLLFWKKKSIEQMYYLNRIPAFRELLLSFKATVIHQEQGKKLFCFTIFKKRFLKSSTVILALHWKQEAFFPQKVFVSFLQFHSVISTSRHSVCTHNLWSFHFLNQDFLS